MAYNQFQGSNPCHVPLDLTVSFSLQQFSKIFKIRDAAGQPYILIGGQAVNFWAERYLSAEPELKLFQPFTSEDIDFKGGKDDVQRIAQQLELTAGYPPKVEMTALAGVIPFRIGDLKSSIEIVRRVPGISGTAEIPAFKTDWNGKTIRVLDPISLLASKLELAATVPQNNRRDALHLKILVPCVRAFLHEVLQQVERGETPARDFLGAANQTLKLTTSQRARRIAKKFQIDWPGILPLAAIARSKDEKIRRFQEQQLQQGFRTSNGISI